MPVDASLLEILACPACHAPLRESKDGAAGEGDSAAPGTPAEPGLQCTSDTCGLVYPVRDEIPVLLVDEARRPA